MRRAIGVMGLLLLGLVGPSAAQAYDATDIAGVSAYRQQLTRILTARVGTLRHSEPGGTVNVRFTVGRDGIVTQSEVAASSGSESTDRLAVGIIPVGLRLPPLPTESRLPRLTVTVPVRFPSRDAAMPESLKAYRLELARLFMRRIQGLPHRMLTGGGLAIRFTVEREGIVTHSAIARSSGNQSIDDLGLRIVPVGLKVPPMPPDLGGRMQITLPLRFGLAPNI